VRAWLHEVRPTCLSHYGFISELSCRNHKDLRQHYTLCSSSWSGFLLL
jgi:hypothetical protein